MHTVTCMVPAADLPAWLAHGWRDLGDMPMGWRGVGEHRRVRWSGIGDPPIPVVA